MVDWQASLYDPIYATLGVDAVITSATDSLTTAVTALEKTIGELLQLGEDNLAVQGIKAAAAVRMSELAANNLSRSDLKGGKIAINGKTWAIASTRPVPGPQGEDAGELYLYLQEITP